MPALVETTPEQAVATEAQPRRSFGHRLLISAIRFLVVMLAAAVIGAGWYLASKGFGRQWRHRIVEELHKRGVEASIRRLTLDPFRGLVAQDVRIFDYNNHENTLAFISEISLDINYAALLHHQPFLNAVDVRNAHITLPLRRGQKKADKPQLRNFRAHVYFPPEQIYVSQAEGFFCGVHVSVTGQLIKRADYKPSPGLTEEEWERRLTILQRVVSELQKFTFPNGPPTLQVKFSGDLADMENGRVTAALKAESARRDKYELRELSAAAEYADQRLTISQFEWKDSAGTFAARANCSRQNMDANFQARSDIDLKGCLDAFGYAEFLTDAIFPTSPNLEISGTAKLGDGGGQLKILGHAGIGRFVYHGVPLSDLTADFSWDGEHTLVRDLQVNQGVGRFKADLFAAPGDFRLNIDSNVNPIVARSFLSPEMQKFLGEWEWQTPPTVHLEIRGPDEKPETWHGNGSIALDRTRFRGVWLDSATSNIQFGDGAVTYDNLRVTRDEGTASGGFTYDFKKREVRITNIKSSLFPAEAINWIDPKLTKTVTPYKFRQAPNLTANGVYQFDGGKNTAIDIHVDTSKGLDYVFLGKTLPFDRVSAKLLFTRDHLQITDLNGAIFSGTMRGNADIALGQDNGRYRANVAVKDIDFPRVTDLYYNFKTAQGRFDGTYDFSGVGSDARTMRGNGKLEVRNGNVFAIPVFGPISEILNAVVPGSGYSIARKATASMTIKDGLLHTDDFEAAGKLFSMLGHGDVHFLDDRLDFDLRLDANGPAAVLTPMYKLFEYVGEGSLKKPNWHPKRF